jgi:hypothetical protein
MDADDLEPTVARVAAWLREQAAQTAFGEIGVKLVLHAGRLSRVEQTVTVKSQPGVEGETRGAGGDHPAGPQSVHVRGAASESVESR